MPNHALIIIDMLHGFLDLWDEAKRDPLIAHSNALIEMARDNGVPVIWIRQEFKADLSDAFLEMRDKNLCMTIEGTKGCQIFDQLDVAEHDPVLVKKRYSVFFNTGLDDLLQDLQIDRPIFAGINTHACIRMAVIDAYQRDYRSIIATDAVDTYDDAHGEISMAYMSSKLAAALSNREIALALGRQEEVALLRRIIRLRCMEA